MSTACTQRHNASGALLSAGQPGAHDTARRRRPRHVLDAAISLSSVIGSLDGPSRFNDLDMVRRAAADAVTLRDALRDWPSPTTMSAAAIDQAAAAFEEIAALLCDDDTSLPTHDAGVMSGTAGRGTEREPDSISVAQRALFEVLELPLHFSDAFGGVGGPCCPAARTVLLYGPPGTGKTTAVGAACAAFGLAWATVSGADLLCRWVGESEARLRRAFEWARAAAPCVLFFDEVDALFGKRGADGESELGRRLKTELLSLVQGVCDSSAARDAPVFVFAATNVPWELDPAFLRRFHEHVYIPLPTVDEIHALVQSLLAGRGFAMRDHNDGDGGGDAMVTTASRRVADALSGCSHAEVVSCCHRILRDAVKAQLRRGRSGSDDRGRRVERFDLDVADCLAAARRQHRAASTDDVTKLQQWGSRCA